jgi:hypothetical protein
MGCGCAGALVAPVVPGLLVLDCAQTGAARKAAAAAVAINVRFMAILLFDQNSTACTGTRHATFMRRESANA